MEAGLAWLAAHQDASGFWDRERFGAHCPVGDVCLGPANARLKADLAPGVTAIALLAFLGAGYTDRDGPYQEVVSRGISALLSAQNVDGGFGRNESQAGYNDPLATLALAEYACLTQDPRIREPLGRAVGRIVASQQGLGGWDYTRSPETGRNDTSIAAWMVQALHAAAAAGVEVPPRSLMLAMLHFDRATEGSGRVWYADAGSGFRLENLAPVYRYGPAMTAAGLTCMQMLGWSMTATLGERQEALLFADPPSAARARGRDPTELHSEYYWYYGTLACFQRGGETWDRWNGKLRDALLPLQDRPKGKEARRHSFGSFAPYGPNWGKWARGGGRVYSTAIAVLTLEIYYRNTPAYLKDDLLVSAADWIDFLEQQPRRQRLAVVACLGKLRVEMSEAALVHALNDPSREVAIAAAQRLAELDSPAGGPLLDEAVSRLPPWGRQEAERAQARIKHLLARPPVRGRLRRFDPESNLASVDLVGAYYGMPLNLIRNGAEVGRMRIVQRFDGRTIAISEVVSLSPGSEPQSGDEVCEVREP